MRDVRQCLGFAMASLFLLTAPMAFGGVGRHYVAPDGDDANSGSSNAPWETLEKASREAEAGDTVFILPGVYHEDRLAPENSGTSDRPIVFRAAVRREAILESAPGHFAVELEEVSHIRLEGLTIRSRFQEPGERNVQTPGGGKYLVTSDWGPGRWLRIAGSRGIQVEDCLLEKSSGSIPVMIEESEGVRFRGNVFRNYFGSDIIRAYDSKRLVFEGNAISRSGHTPLAFSMGREVDGSNRYIVMRANVFHPSWARPLEIQGDPDVLFEDNVLVHAYNGARNAGTVAQLSTYGGIFRYNRFYRNWGSPLRLAGWRGQAFGCVRIYNNVFHDNAHRAMRVNNTEDLIFKNNIFWRNDPFGNYRQFSFRGDADSVRFIRNVITGREPGQQGTMDRFETPDGVFHFRRTDPREPLDLSIAQEPEDAERHGAQFVENLDMDPRFKDPSIYNHALREDSPLRNAGAFLTRTTNAGEGKVVAVEDAAYFYDGFGIEGERGDAVFIGAPDRLARVAEIDRERNRLTLDRAVRWEVGEPVSLAWSSKRPDIGAYEHGAGGRPYVQVVTEPFSTQPGDEVQLRAKIGGIDEVSEISWQLGDGTVASGQEITHVYDAPYDYPVRVLARTADGREIFGAAVVVVEVPRREGQPLVRSTFGAEDDAWWRLWQNYRPRSGETEWERVLDEETGEGWLEVRAPVDGAVMPSWLHPAAWNIDEDPMVKLTYRVEPGTRVGLYLEAFETLREGSRRVLAAASPAAELHEEDPFAGYELTDNGEWQVLELDARLVREWYPDVDVLMGLRFQAVPVDKSRVDDAYALQEVIIGPLSGR